MTEANRLEKQILPSAEPRFSVTESRGQEFIDSKAEDGKTIRRVLSGFEIGRKLRQLRLRKKIALVDLGKHTGLSASMLSQLENGKLIPTLPTLARIAMVFDIGVDYFFVEKKDKQVFSVVRAAERLKFPDLQDSTRPGFFFECLAYSVPDKTLQAYMAEFPRRGEDEIKMHKHDGAEFLHLLEGRIEIRYHEEAHIIEAGDSVYFDGSEPHSYRGLAKSVSRALVITTVPQA